MLFSHAVFSSHVALHFSVAILSPHPHYFHHIILLKVVGATEVPWDVRVESVRTCESSVGSFSAGVMRARYGADVGFLAGGTFRSDQVYGPGKLLAKDIMNIFPFSDPCVVIKCTGKTLLEALENGVSKYPAHEGRFPQVSGIRFAFDPKLEPGSRIVKVDGGEVVVEGEMGDDG